MITPVNYKAFISYAHQDAAWAGRLQRMLENYQLPKSSAVRWPLRPIFLDRLELSSSPDLSNSIEQALRHSDALIVVCSQAAAASKWVNAEILFFKRLGRHRIFPIVISGEPGSNDLEETCFPEALLFQLDQNGNLSATPAEPLAADARSGRDGKDAVLKLIAGLLDVPFDTLKLRQQRRRERQALGLATAAAAMAVIMGYLTITAVVAKADAERRRDQAEDLISFMLGDLRDRLQPVGRLDVLDGVGEKALQYFASLTESDQTSESMLTRATALRQIGEVRVAQGRSSDGLIAFQQALALLNNSSSVAESVRLFEIGQINYWIADAHFRELKLTEAHSYIKQYLKISRQLVQLEPNNQDYQLELLYAESNLGTLAFRSNELSAAREYFTNALKIGRRISMDQKSDAHDIELANTISWLGAVEASSGNLAAAQIWYQEELGLRKALRAARETPERKRRVGHTLRLLAETLQQSGQPDVAVRALEESVQLARELAAYDPQNVEWQRELAWSLTVFSRDSYTSGLNTAAQARATIALAADTLSHIKKEDSAEANRVSAAIDLELGRIELLEGYPQEAFALISNSVEKLAPLVLETDRIRLVPLYARANYWASEAALALGNEAESRRIAENCLAILNLQEDDPIETRAYAALLAHRAQSPTADRLLAAVRETEYRAQIYIPNGDAELWWRAGIH